MFNITENTTTWPSAVRGYETTTPVLGGDNSSLGDSNLPIDDLANRTGYLYDRLGRFEDVVKITSAITVNAANKFKLHYIIASGNITITIDDLANLQHGAIYPFKCKCPVNKIVTIQTTGGQEIRDGGIVGTKQYLADGEEFNLVVFKDGSDDHFVMIDAKGNYDKVGQDDLLRFQPRNSIIANGCQPELFGTLYNRADLQRLWDKVSAVAIDDATWLSDPFLYRCMFSTGNGSTTFRVPDMRAMFVRGLDLGRGVRLGQLDNTPGSYEVDDNKSHNHTLATTNSALSFNAGADPMRGSIAGTPNTRGGEGSGKTIGQQGSSEVKPKNTGFLPIIYY